jgi:hypothetical protein
MDLLDKVDLFFKMSSTFDDLDKLRENVGNYIHFSDSDRFGISYHKDIHPGNPRGVYGIKLTPKLVSSFISGMPVDEMYDYSGKKYVYIFSVSGNILNIDSAKHEELFNAVRRFLVTYYSGKVSDFELETIKYSSFAEMNPYAKRNGEPGDILPCLRKFYDILRSGGAIKNQHSFYNIVWRGIGVDALETSNNGFHDGIKSQIAVVSPSAAALLHKINNPLY